MGDADPVGLALEEAIFDAKLDIAAAPAWAGPMVVGESERQGGGELDVLDGAIIEVEPGGASSAP